MKYIGTDRVYIDQITNIGVKLENNCNYPAVIIRDNNHDSVTFGINAEVVIDYSLGEIIKEWEV